MGFIDGHLHSVFLSYYDIELMVHSSYDGFVTLAYTPIPPSNVDSLREHFEHLMFEKNRCGGTGLRVYVGVGIHPRCIPSGDIGSYLGIVEEYLGNTDVLGEVGLETGSDVEVRVLEEQLRIAKRLDKPVIIHTPRANKHVILRRIIDVVNNVGLPSELVVIDHLLPSPILLDLIVGRGYWLGFTIQPGKVKAMDVLWVVKNYPESIDKIIVNSDSGLYPCNPLAVKEAYEVLSEHMGKADAYKLVSLNAVRFLKS